MAVMWSWQVYIRHQYIEHIHAVYPINYSSTLYQYALFCVSITVDSCDPYTYNLQDYLSGIGTFGLLFMVIEVIFTVDIFNQFQHTKIHKK